MPVANRFAKNATTKTVFPIMLCSAIFFVLPAARGATLYNSLPSPDQLSWPYEVEETSEFGGLVQLAGDSPFTLESAVVGMSNWAQQSSWTGVGTANGYIVPLTLNLYNVNADQTVGTLFDSLTVQALIPWCATGCTDTYTDSGLFTTVTFN